MMEGELLKGLGPEPGPGSEFLCSGCYEVSHEYLDHLPLSILFLPALPAALGVTLDAFADLRTRFQPDNCLEHRRQPQGPVI